MKASLHSNKNEARETLYLVLMLLVLGAFSSVLYLLPPWIFITGFLTVVVGVFTVEIIVDHTSFRSQKTFKSISSRKFSFHSNP